MKLRCGAGADDDAGRVADQGGRAADVGAKASRDEKWRRADASRSQTSRVTGAINRTVVTLSRKADPIAVMSTSRIMIRSGEPLARLADQIAMYSNTPVWRTTLTMIIIPSSRKMTSQSIPVSSE